MGATAVPALFKGDVDLVVRVEREELEPAQVELERFLKPVLERLRAQRAHS